MNKLTRTKKHDYSWMVVLIPIFMLFLYCVVSAAANEAEATETSREVIMEAKTQTATPEETETTCQSLIYSYDWDEQEAEMLLKIAMAEAEGESVEGKALVMLVVLNRVWSEEFPDTIEEVIFQSGQFTVTNDGGRYYTTEPNEECYEALDLVASGWDNSNGALYFESSKNETSWQSENTTFLFQYGNHRFYK